MTSDEAEAGQPVENWHVHYQGCPSCALLQDEARAELRAKLAAKVRRVPAPHTHPRDSLCITGCPHAVRAAVLALIEGSDPASPEARLWHDDGDEHTEPECLNPGHFEDPPKEPHPDAELDCISESSRG